VVSIGKIRPNTDGILASGVCLKNRFLAASALQTLAEMIRKDLGKKYVEHK
jgi:hypothetical protein